MSTGIELVVWAPKVKRQRIRELYENDSAGLTDRSLVDEVGWGLYARCQAILQVTAAHVEGKITCPACERQFLRDARSDTLACTCGWEVSWTAYHKTYQGRQLIGVNAYQAFADYVRQFPILTSESLKMVAIDQLIHQFHTESKESIKVIGRPVGANLVEGNLHEVCLFLDELSSANPSLAGSQAAWRGTLAKADWSEEFRPKPKGEQAG